MLITYLGLMDTEIKKKYYFVNLFLFSCSIILNSIKDKEINDVQWFSMSFVHELFNKTFVVLTGMNKFTKLVHLFIRSIKAIRSICC